jgi:hypothetical protein
MKMIRLLFILSFFALLQSVAFSQKKDKPATTKDSIKTKDVMIDSAAKNDTLAKKKHNPTKATLYSTIFPGLGQAYNKKYWKLPIVYAAVGIPVYTFFYNRSWYNKTRYALAVIVNGSYTNVDSFNKIDPEIRKYVLNSDGSLNSSITPALIVARDDYRKNEDYSVLFFLLFYALQIVDATVDAHLKDFNVSSDLSMRIKPNIMPGPSGTGLSLLFDIHKAKPRALFDTR